MKIFLVVLVAAFGVGSGVRAESPRQEHFESGGESIRVDVFGPTSSARPVIVLHGAGGMMFDGAQVEAVAQALAERGLTAYVVSYFDRTGHWFVMGDGGLIKGFPKWAEVIDDAVKWVEGKSGGAKVGLYGYSLGGFLVVAQAAGDDRVAAVVTQSGGIWDRFAEVKGELPPILVIHGKADERVYFDENTEKIRKVVREFGTPMETMFFKDEAHRFSDTAMARVRERTAAFLDGSLGDR